MLAVDQYGAPKALFLVHAVTAVVLLFLVAVYGSRVVESHLAARVKLGGPGSTGLKASTVSYLGSLRGRVTLTYFVSARKAMPSSMKGVEDAVRSLLEEVRRAAPEAVDVRVIDPAFDREQRANGEDVVGEYASGKSASPVKVRKVLRDESSEESVWSSLSIAHEQLPDALIQDIAPADLPYLEDLIVENLKAAASPIQPVVAVSAPGRGHARVRELIPSFQDRDRPSARVVLADFERNPRIPPEADLFVWIDPRTATREHSAELERFLKSGRSAIIAGSAYSVEYLPRGEGKTAYRIVRSSCDWDALLKPFGLSFVPLLLLDKNHEAIAWRTDAGATLKVDAPFHLRILPSLFDTKSLLGPNAGALLVHAVSAILPDPKALAASGRKAEVVATTSEHARVIELPDGELDDAYLEGARFVPKQPWMFHLRPSDPWQGELVVAGSPGLFRDEIYDQGGNANQVFFRTLLRTFTHGPRLARTRVPRIEPPRVPPLSLGSRVAWRGVTVLLVPAAVLVLALRRARARPLGPVRVPWLKPSLAGAAAFVALLLAAVAWRDLWDPRADLTEDGVNTASPLTSRILEGCRDRLEAELLISDALHMPASLKGLERRIVSALRGLGVRPRLARPEDLPPGAQAGLRAAGVEPFDVETIEDDAPVTARVWSSLRLRLGDRSEVVPQIDPRSAEHLEFLLAAAVRRLQGQRAPLVGVLSDLPRLTPAEAHSDYQEKGYTAPVGADVYSFAKRLLARYGYATAYINPDVPVFPEGMDVLVWLQPRFPWKVLPQFGKLLAGGGKAVVAVQHYNVQQRQYRGTGFKTVYWPAPQFHSSNDYLKLIGVRQIGEKLAEEPGEVLFDRQHANLVLETQVNRSAWREHDPQQVARPFLIRAAGDGLSKASVITSRLGALLFIWGSRFSFDDETLGRLGLGRTVLVTTSPRCWTYAWSGGWIPDESFQEPAPAAFLPGPQPLAVLIEGTFPQVQAQKDEKTGRDTVVLAPAPAQDSGSGSAPGSAPGSPPDSAPGSPPSSAPGKPGQLVLVGSSEMFKNAHLSLPGYQHDQLLLNAVALLAHGPELAEIQARTRTPRALAYQPPGVKETWRWIAGGLSPVLFVLYGLLHWCLRRKPVLGG
ncbi:MAG: Gldg family protein [Planctomycetes bacterium]|nr:Gldg family protein [Planctomycetota bacterium]